VDRLHGSKRMRKIQEVDIPEITLPVAPGRNLAVLLEAAVRNHILNVKGYDASQAFIDRQKRRLEKAHQ
jgi:HPr kinase/phosphorylase